MNLTLVIPTFNRPDNLRKLLSVLRHFSFDGEVIVADSSSDDSRQINQQQCARWAATTYVEYSLETPPFQKFAQAIALAQTKYIALLADDDLAFPSGLSQCVSFLEENPRYSAAHGTYLRFDVHGNRMVVPGVEYDAPSIEDDTAFGRLNSLMSNYQALTYSVQRKDCAQAAFESAYIMKGLLWQELTGGSVTAMLGRVKRLDAITHARQGGSTLGYERWHPVEWLIRDASGLFQGFAEYVEAIEKIAGNSHEPIETHDAANAAGLRYLLPFLSHAHLVAFAPEKQGVSQELRLSTAIDRWNDLRSPFPKSIFLKHKCVGDLARAVKRIMLRTHSGGYANSVVGDDGVPILVEFAKSVVLKEDNDTLNYLSEQLALYVVS